MAQKYKVCKMCREKKLRGMFGVHRRTHDGFNSRCRMCEKIAKIRSAERRLLDIPK